MIVFEKPSLSPEKPGFSKKPMTIESINFVFWFDKPGFSMIEKPGLLPKNHVYLFYCSKYLPYIQLVHTHTAFVLFRTLAVENVDWPSKCPHVWKNKMPVVKPKRLKDFFLNDDWNAFHPWQWYKQTSTACKYVNPSIILAFWGLRDRTVYVRNKLYWEFNKLTSLIVLKRSEYPAKAIVITD